MKLQIGFLAAVWAATAMGPMAVRAAEKGMGRENLHVEKIVLYPAPEPRPALRYQLLPPIVDRRPGNAAVFYNRIPAERTPFFRDYKLLSKVAGLQMAPLAELRQQEAQSAIGSSADVLDDLHRAARSEYCDWQVLIREKEFYSLNLAEFQETRTFARTLAAWVRREIAVGDYSAAVDGLQTGYALGRDVSRAPFAVPGLIGIVIAGMMDYQVETLIRQPDAPNLYWALSGLPRPFFDLRENFQGEMYSLCLSDPELRDVESNKYSGEFWGQFLQKLGERLLEWGSVPRQPREQEWVMEGAWLLHAYPKAKRLLVERGRSPEKVEAMPAPQAILAAEMLSYDELRDNQYKWLTLPYPAIMEAAARVEKTRSGGEVLPVAELLLPSFRALRAEVPLRVMLDSQARQDRKIALLQTLEALRLYGADHGGQLPEGLNDLDPPAPLDPVRNKPFPYRRRGDTAILEVIGQPGFSWYSRRGEEQSVRYEITFGRRGK